MTNAGVPTDCCLLTSIYLSCADASFCPDLALLKDLEAGIFTVFELKPTRQLLSAAAGCVAQAALQWLAAHYVLPVARWHADVPVVITDCATSVHMITKSPQIPEEREGSVDLYSYRVTQHSEALRTYLVNTAAAAKAAFVQRGQYFLAPGEGIKKLSPYCIPALPQC